VNGMTEQDNISKLIVSQAVTQKSIDVLDKKTDSTIDQIAAMNGTLSQMLEIQIRHEERNKVIEDKVEKIQGNLINANHRINQLENKTDKTQSVTNNLVKITWFFVASIIAGITKFFFTS
jgi:hypothetical protein